MQTAFAKPRAAGSGPGDYKVSYTSKVDARSIGRGKRVPVWMVPPAPLAAVNAVLPTLGYQPLMNGASPEALSGFNKGTAWGARLAELMRRAQPVRHNGWGPVDSFALVAEDGEKLRWVIDLAAGVVRQGEGKVDLVVTGSAEDLVLMLSGEVNPGVLLHSGRIRHLTSRADLPPEAVAGTMQGWFSNEADMTVAD